MIQPLDTSRNSWRLLWLDLEEPVPKPAFALNAPNVSLVGLQGSELE